MCHKNGTIKDHKGNEVTKFSNLNYGLRPIFRNQRFEGKIEENQTQTFFPIDAIASRVKFVFTGKESGDYKLVGVKVSFRLNGVPLFIGNLSPRDASETVIIL